MNDRMGAKFFAALTDIMWGKMFAERKAPGDPERARELLTKSHLAAVAHGYTNVQRRGDSLAPRLGLSPRLSASSGSTHKVATVHNVRFHPDHNRVGRFPMVPVGAENLTRNTDQGRCARKNARTCRATYVPHSVAAAVRQDPDGELQILFSNPIRVFGIHWILGLVSSSPARSNR